MKHQTIYKQLNISYKNYTKLRNKYRFFAYITDLLTLDYVLSIAEELSNNLLIDLREALRHKGVLQGLDLAMFGGLNCFSEDNLHHIRSLADAINRFQSHKWQYDMPNNKITKIENINVISI
jgi:hypothetical protein